MEQESILTVSKHLDPTLPEAQEKEEVASSSLNGWVRTRLEWNLRRWERLKEEKNPKDLGDQNGPAPKEPVAQVAGQSGGD